MSITAEKSAGTVEQFNVTIPGADVVSVTATWTPGYDKLLQPAIGSDGVNDILEEWEKAAPGARKYLWGTTERSDDDAFLSWTDESGVVNLQSWPTGNPSDTYNLETLELLLPASHLIVASAD
ncbi:hypothetical protein [Leifsonia sp. Leaf264]|uniref:hypothetical protein n=1 Tax=Leifsonia sp. Leaf264 TaxID=1736314 RepID=UPI0006F7029B|nr:hypothetical protein [Leifsonia sp. Leaf264]KQO98895.1 hypothetical protein ASF30_12600 [Leifsonia sp. Leaf264]